MAGWVGGSFVRFVHRRVVAFKPFYIPSSQHTPVYPPAASNPFFAHPHPYRRTTATTTTTARAACKTDLMLESCNQLKQVEDTAPPVFSQSVSAVSRSSFGAACKHTHTQDTLVPPLDDVNNNIIRTYVLETEKGDLIKPTSV